MEALKRLTGQAPPAPPKAKAAVKAAAPAGPSVLSLVCSKKFLVYWYATPPTEASGTLATHRGWRGWSLETLRGTF